MEPSEFLEPSPEEMGEQSSDMAQPHVDFAPSEHSVELIEVNPVDVMHTYIAEITSFMTH